MLKYGSLPLSFHNLYTSSVSASLGSDQLSAGLFAALVGLLLVVIYSFIYYRGLGLVSVLSLAIAATITYLSVVLLSKYEGFTLTLAGIAGLIVAIGITADSFIVYFERLRDEVREGRSLRAAVERGWTRARRTILVSDTVSFLAALLLYILSEGDVRGFAFTLGLTTLVDVIVVFLFTKPMITLLARTKFYGQGHKLSGLDPARLGARAPWRGGRRPPPSGPAASGAATRHGPRPAPGRRDVAARQHRTPGGCTAARSPSTSSAARSSGTSISGCILLVSVLALLIRGLNYSVDFKGGSQWTVPATASGHADRGWSRSSPNGGGVNASATEVRPFDGQGRSGRCRPAQLPTTKALEIGDQIAAALQAAERQRVRSRPSAPAGALRSRRRRSRR